MISAKMISALPLGQILLRTAAAGLALGGSLLVARQLSIDQIAYYFTFATIAYFGNALIFVGASVHLQKRLAELATANRLAKQLLMRYLIALAPMGAGVVLLGGTVYLSTIDLERFAAAAAACAMLSLGTFLASVAKDLWSLAARPLVAASVILVEQAVKVASFVYIVAQANGTDAIAFTGAAALSCSCVGAVGIVALMMAMPNYTGAAHDAVEWKKMSGTILPTAVSGVSNWLQLQSYRPLALLGGAPLPALGATSLLMTLGSTGANPVFSVVFQSHLPAIYRREPYCVSACVRKVAIVAAALCIAGPLAGTVFLHISDQSALYRYLPLVAAGVLVEAGNCIIGAYMHSWNANERPLWPLSLASFMGAAVAVGTTLVPVSAANLPYVIGCGLVLSQGLVTYLVSRWSGIGA